VARHEGCVPALQREAFAPIFGGILFPFSRRVRLGYLDEARAFMALRGITGKRLTYRVTVRTRAVRVVPEVIG
jgi:hypothetical protein